MISADASLLMTYKSRKTGDTFTLNLSDKELKEIYDNPVSEDEINRFLFESQIQMENDRCPYVISDGMEMTSVEDNGTYVVFNTKVDENHYNLDAFESMGPNFKEALREILKKDLSINQEVKIMASQNRGLIYRYYGDRSHKKADVVFSVEELKDL